MCGPEPAPPPRVSLEVQSPGPYPDLANQKLWEWGSSISVLTTIYFDILVSAVTSGWFWLTGELEKPCSGTLGADSVSLCFPCVFPTPARREAVKGTEHPDSLKSWKLGPCPPWSFKDDPAGGGGLGWRGHCEWTALCYTVQRGQMFFDAVCHTRYSLRFFAHEHISLAQTLCSQVHESTAHRPQILPNCCLPAVPSCVTWTEMLCFYMEWETFLRLCLLTCGPFSPSLYQLLGSWFTFAVKTLGLSGKDRLQVKTAYSLYQLCAHT